VGPGDDPGPTFCVWLDLAICWDIHESAGQVRTAFPPLSSLTASARTPH
jgi:hypothetical protein